MIHRWALGVFAPLLLLVGVMGFVMPGDRGATSSAPAYNVFGEAVDGVEPEAHLVFGALGLALVVGGNQAAIRSFLVAFGLIDLYQALASRQRWFPEALFRWKPMDDLLHVVIGVILVVIAAVP